jgi:hypothetical protein
LARILSHRKSTEIPPQIHHSAEILTFSAKEFFDRAKTQLHRIFKIVLIYLKLTTLFDIDHKDKYLLNQKRLLGNSRATPSALSNNRYRLS